MKRFLAMIGLVTLGACAQATSDDPFSAAVQHLRGGLFNGGQAAPEPFTATRASLTAAGITQPVLVVRMRDAGIAAGLLEYRTTRGVTIWRSLDGNTISTDAGLLRNTRGFGPDLHSLETEALRHALQQGNATEYSRVFRALDGEGHLEALRLYCTLDPEAAERVDVLGRAYDTRRFRESCTVDGSASPVFVNTYWQGRGGEIWRSRQWVGPELGYAELEFVIN